MLTLNFEPLSNDGPVKLYDEAGAVATFADGPEAHDYLYGAGVAQVLFDVDGAGTMRPIPVEWVGDGEPIERSPRALALV